MDIINSTQKENKNNEMKNNCVLYPYPIQTMYFERSSAFSKISSLNCKTVARQKMLFGKVVTSSLQCKKV